MRGGMGLNERERGRGGTGGPTQYLLYDFFFLGGTGICSGFFYVSASVWDSRN